MPAMNPKDKGELIEQIVISEFMRRGVSVSVPVKENCRYDFIIDVSDELLRVQCKSARYNEDHVDFETSSYQANNTEGGKENYIDEIDYFVAHTIEIGDTFIMDVDECGSYAQRIRLTPPKNNQKDGITMAEDVHIDSFLGEPTI